MSGYLYQYPAGQTPQDNSAFVAELVNGDSVYLLPHEDVGGTLVGEWGNDGQLVSVDSGVYSELRPIGNDDGFATDHLDLTHYQGHAQRHMQDIPVVDTLPYYPISQQPFTLRITRTLTTDDAWPHIPWGWTVEMISADPLRSITARAIGIYTGEDSYLYTAGAFVLDGETYSTSCPIGQRTANPNAIHFKLLLGAGPEGAWQLTDLEEGAAQERLFWAGDQ